MKLLKILSSITGKHYCVWSAIKSLEKLHIDSLTFVEFVLRVEEELGIKIDSSQMVELYHVKLISWKRKLKRESQ